MSVADLGGEPCYVPPLRAIGLVLRSRDEMHRFLRPAADQPREVHVHVCAAGGQWEYDHLLFRDYLRAHPAACRRYAEAKRAIVRRWSDDSWAYTGAKTGTISTSWKRRGSGLRPPDGSLTPFRRPPRVGALQP